MDLDFGNIQRLLKDKDVSGDLASRMEYFAKTQQKGVTAPAEQAPPQTVKSTGGATLPALILSSVESEEGKPRTTYEMLLYKDFGNLHIASTEGESLPNGRIALNIHARDKMTEVQRAEFLKDLDAAGVNANDLTRNRLYKESTDGTVELESGTLVRLIFWGAPLTKGPDQPYIAGDFVFIVGLKPKITRDVDGKSKYGVQWDFDGLMADPNADREMAARCWENLAAMNVIPDLSYAGGYGPHNRDEAAIKYEQDLSGNKLGNKENWRVTFNQIPAEKRSQIDKLFVLPLYRANDRPTPAEMVARSCVHVDNPIWESNWMGSKEDQATKKMHHWKTASMRAKAIVLFAGSGKPVNITVSIGSKLLDAFGITPVERWAAIAPILVPKCGGRAVCKLNLIDSVGAPENNPDMNVARPDGTYSLGAAYGAAYRVNILTPDVAEGAVRAGLEIDADATKFLLKQAYKTEDLSHNPPTHVEKWAKDNQINNRPIKPVINVFEYCENVDKLARDGYAFFYVSKNLDKDHPNSEFFIDALAKSGKAVEIMSRGLMGSFEDNSLRGFINLPSNPNEYCVFAVKRDLVAKYSQPPVVLNDEQFVEQMLAEAAKLGASNKRTLEEAVPAPVAKVAKPAEVASPAAVAAASDEDDDEDEAYNPLAMATD